MLRRECRAVGVLAHTLLCVALGLGICAHGFAASIDRLIDQPDRWFESDEGVRTLENIISLQNAGGGWWKSYDTSKPRPAGYKPAIDPRWPLQDQNVSGITGSFDNKATYSELRVLARAVRVTGRQEYRDAFARGLKFVFDAQYENGGWPQRYPLEDNYGQHITFNDKAMVSVMTLLRDIATGVRDFQWIDEQTQRRAQEAFDRGVECILDCQIHVEGCLTAWGQQHDAQTLQPAPARSYELPSISSAETCEIVLLLMELDDPSPRVRQAIGAAINWLECSKITGIRLEKRPAPELPGGNDVVVVDDPDAPPLWARFYDIPTNRPFFAGRDGVKKWSLAEIEPERRAGYAWLRPWGTKVLEEYAKWAKTHGSSHSTSP